MKNKYVYLVVIFLIIASFIAYSRILGNGFTNFDDDVYLTGNNYIKSGLSLQNIKWAFTTVISGNWHPLTLLSHTTGLEHIRRKRFRSSSGKPASAYRHCYLFISLFK